MTFPANVTLVTVTGQFLRTDGHDTPATGQVSFTPNANLIDGGTGDSLVATPVIATLDATGSFSVQLMATDDLDLSPTGWAYRVVETVDQGNRAYLLQFPAVGSPFELADMAPIVTQPELIQYVVASGGAGTPSGTVVSGTSFGQASTAGVSAAYSRGDHAHGTPAAPSVPAFGSPVASAVGDTAADGVAATVPRADHRHAREAFGNVVALTAYGVASANGAATTEARADHVHGSPSIVYITTPNLFSGAWYVLPGQGGTGTSPALAAGTALFLALVPLRDCTLSGLAVEITTIDTGNVRFGLASDVNGQPGSWLNDFGVVTAGSTGLVQPASTPNVALLAGTRYWVGIVPQGGAAALVLRARATCEPNIPTTPTPTATPGAINALRNCYTSTGWAGALSGAITVAAVASGPCAEARLT